MSIAPLPELPSEPEGFRLSVLDSYLGHPDSLKGVGFWPRTRPAYISLFIT